MYALLKRPLVLFVLVLALVDIVSIQAALSNDRHGRATPPAASDIRKPSRLVAVDPPSVVTTDSRKTVFVETPPPGACRFA